MLICNVSYNCTLMNHFPLKETIFITSLLEKKISARATAVEICEVDGDECTVSKTTAIEWLFRRFNNRETSPVDLPSSGRPSTIINIEAQRELVEQQP